MSKISVPFIKSAPETISTGPSFSLFSTSISLTRVRPIGFGRFGERVANTPFRMFPPSFGGRTVGDHARLPIGSKPQISHRYSNSSIPLNASKFLYSASITTREIRFSAIPLCLGSPNLVGKSLYIFATGLMFI